MRRKGLTETQGWVRRNTYLLAGASLWSAAIVVLLGQSLMFVWKDAVDGSLVEARFANQALTLIDKDVMARGGHFLGKSGDEPQGHITSLDPVSPKNQPDDWEKKALHRLAAGATETSEVTNIDGRRRLRLMRPLIIEQDCLQCHAGQGYKAGDMRGGISVDVPMATRWDTARSHIRKTAAGYGMIWLLGLSAVALATLTIQRRGRERAGREAEFRDLFDNAPVAYHEIDRDGVIRRTNRAECILLGYAAGQMLGRPIWEFVVDAERDVSREAIRRKLAGEQPLAPVQRRFTRRDGGELLLEIHESLVRDVMGEIVGIRSALVDITERQRAEEALRRAAEHWQSTFDAVNDAICLLDADHRILLCNRAMAALAGSAPAGLIGRYCWEVIHGASKPIPGCPLVRMQTSHRREQIEMQLGDRWINVTADPLLDERQNLRGGVHVVRDITERKRAEEAARASMDRHQTILRTAMDGFWLADMQGRLLEVNETYERMSGYSAEELTTMQISDLEVVETKDETAAHVEKVMAQGEHRFESRHRRKDGSLIWVEVSVQHQPSGGGRLVAFLRDITERKRAEEALRESEARFKAIATSTPDHIVVQDQDLRYEWVVNPQLGLTVESMKGRTDYEILPGDDAEMLMTVKRGVLESGKPVHMSTPLTSLQGATQYFDGTFLPRHDSAGRIDGLIGYFRNVTELKRAEQERERLQAALTQAQKMESIGRLAGGVAHDFNNLLTVINGYSQLLVAKLNEGDPLRPAVEQIQKAGEQAAGLTRQLLAFSRKQVLQVRVLDLNEVVVGAHSMLVRLLGENVRVRVALNAESAMVRADPYQLQQAIVNLAVNSRDAMPDGGKLLIETAYVEFDQSYAGSHPNERLGRYVMLAVSDTGAGMDEQTRRQIFEPFFTTKGVGKGTGLGLSMVQGIVAQSGGYIEVYSEPGHGTTFKIYLPRVEEEAAAGAGAPETVPALGGRETVLVVEDQEDVRQYAVAVLKSYGYRVIDVESAGEAVSIYERGAERIDLVLTDVVMPEVDGRELAERLEKLQPGIKVLFMSGYTDNVILYHGALEEGAHFLEKPFNPEQLAAKVREVLGLP